MLLEGQGGAVVCGIGVNLVQAPDLPGRPTAALADIGAAPPPAEFAEALAHAFADELARWRADGLPQLVRRWEDQALPRGTAVTAHGPDGKPVAGRYAGLTAEGALRLETGAEAGLESGDRRTHIVHSGEVALA